jgi:hypothetical protein
MPHHGAKSSFSAKRDFVYVKHHFFLKNDTPPTQNHNFLSGLPLETLPEKPCGGDRNSGFVSAMCCPHIWPGLARNGAQQDPSQASSRPACVGTGRRRNLHWRFP